MDLDAAVSCKCFALAFNLPQGVNPDGSLGDSSKHPISATFALTFAKHSSTTPQSVRKFVESLSTVEFPGNRTVSWLDWKYSKAQSENGGIVVFLSCWFFDEEFPNNEIEAVAEELFHQHAKVVRCSDEAACVSTAKKVCDSDTNAHGHDSRNSHRDCVAPADEHTSTLPSTSPAIDIELEEVELYCSTPSRFPLIVPTSVDVITLPSLGNKSEKCNALLRDVGMAVMKQCVSKEDIDRCRRETRLRIELADEVLTRRGIDVGTEDFRFKEISTRGSHRFDLLIGEDEIAIRELAASAPWVPVIHNVLGEDAVCDISLVYSRPGAVDQTWHADGPHIGATADWSGCGEAPAYALCVFLPLIDLDSTVGFTQFWPGSHKYDGLIGFGPVCPLLECELDAVVDAGSAVIYDYRLIHRGMANVSDGVERPIIQFLYHIPTYREERNYGSESLLSTTS